MNEQETLEFLDKQIDLENSIIEKVEQNTAELGNMFIKDLLLGIAQDSKKHATLLHALKALTEKKTPMIDEAQRDKIAAGVEEHIQLEAGAIKTYTELVENSDDKAVQTIAGLIRDDEIEHHKILVDLHKTLIAPQTLSEDDLWSLLWEDSAWHGSPGG